MTITKPTTRDEAHELCGSAAALIAEMHERGRMSSFEADLLLNVLMLTGFARPVRIDDQLSPGWAAVMGFDAKSWIAELRNT